VPSDCRDGIHRGTLWLAQHTGSGTAVSAAAGLGEHRTHVSEARLPSVDGTLPLNALLLRSNRLTGRSGVRAMR
jgi:hypothetical protein